MLYLSNIFPNHPCTKRDTKKKTGIYFEINNHGGGSISKPPECMKSLSQRIYGYKYVRKTEGPWAKHSSQEA